MNGYLGKKPLNNNVKDIVQKQTMHATKNLDPPNSLSFTPIV